MLRALEAHADWPVAYGRAWNMDKRGVRTSRMWVQAFSERRLARRCIVAQPATLIRRQAWEVVGGADEHLQVAMDYDLWWRLYRRFGPLGFVREDVALNRCHAGTKTCSLRRRHYQEAIDVVRRHHGRVPLKWWLAWPFAVWVRAWLAPQRGG